MADTKKYTVVKTGEDDDPENFTVVPTEAALVEAAKVKTPRRTKKRAA